MAGSDGTAVVATNADLTHAIADGALGQPASGTDQAATIGVDSATLVGTGATVQAVLEELDNAIVAAEVAEAAHESDATGAHAATAILVDSTDLTGVAVNVQTVLVELDNAFDVEQTLAGTYRPLYSTLTADTASASEDITVNASGLTVTAGVGTYDIEAFLPYSADAVGDFKVQFGGTAVVTATVGVSDIYYMMGPLQGGDATSHQAIPTLLPTSWTTAYEILTTGAPSLFPTLFKGKLVVTTGGTIIVSFAQVTSTVFATIIGKGAYLKLQRVA